jgi:hypothetical protein
MDPVVGMTTEITDWPELDATSVADLHLVEADGVPLGRLVEVALRWFLMDSRVDGDPLAPQTARRFLRAARQVARSLRIELETRRPDTMVLLNGRFFFESIAAHIGASLGIDVVTYERGFLPSSLFVKRGEPACLYDVGPAAWSQFQGVDLTHEESDRLDHYIEDRRAGRTGFWSYWDDPTTDVPDQAAGVRRVGLFTNLTWDSAVIGRGRACDSIQHWLDTVIAAAADRAPHEFVIRIHPAERKLAGKQTREPILGYLRDAHPGGVPPNVRVVGPEDPLSSYALMAAIDIGMVFSSTTGLELTLAGVPTIAAGAPHYGGRGFTADPPDPAALIATLDEMLEDPDSHRPDVGLARRYAYLCWFRASLPFPYVEEPYRGLSRLAVDSEADLRPGRSADLDHLCDVLLGLAEPVRG